VLCCASLPAQVLRRHQEKEIMMKQFLIVCISLWVVVAVQNVSYAESKKGPDQKTAGSQSGTPASAVLSGTVVDTMDSGGYTYVQLDQGDKKIWVAGPQMKVKKGQKMTFRPGMVMENFESKTLKRNFDKIVFSEGPVDQKAPAAGGMKSGGSKAVTAAPTEKITVDKATGPNAYTIAEVYKDSKSLKGKSVTVKAKVVKVSAGVMKMNWVHLQDGTGDAKKSTHDLVATTSELPATGDVVTVSGTVAADKDFGSGYKYDVLLEKATFKK
jgi:hypothetical protein